MRLKSLLLAAGLALALGAGPAAGQSSQGSYLYCYAWADGYGRVFVTDSVRFVPKTSYDQTIQAFLNGVRGSFGLANFAASGCRPAYDSPDRNAVENERITYIQQERNNGKSVTVTRW